ncbi:formyl transferase [Dyella caseinilytica]|uniref:phosphoribosylglycinamide formyltransferase 1 n=1 Tax=Dyella caseinilytica TaxID=1849581 RepID=A0ABX7GSZ6_9GAMM|nr:formyl transferase [Dyella caseinilytica]QRN53561.1 formyl transferase [Dyella caseinilytica]GFZ87337.1 formyl transferase [Dyella caseinilytica]
MPAKVRIVMLAVDCLSTRAMYHSLREEFDIVEVVLERKTSVLKMLRHRARKLGLTQTLGQFAFILYSRLLGRASRARMEQLLSQHGLSDEPISTQIVNHVASTNERSVAKRLRKLAPQAVVVNGTRILSKKLLTSVDAPFINMHMGVTPAYRGVHGGYWALASDDRMRCGVTVHLVDAGVDTGGILYQALIAPEAEDNFTTYPVLQLVQGLPLMSAALRDVAAGRLVPRVSEGPSRQWYHPTLFGYWQARQQRGVK